MRRGREIIGLPVIELETGKEIGSVTDLAWNHDQRRITAIGLDGGGVVSRTGFICSGHIRSVGQDAVTVSGKADAGAPGGGDGDRSINAMAGALVVTGSGRNLGTLQDLVLDGDGESLAGYEVSDGLVGDIISGREMLPPEAVVIWDGDVVIVRDAGGKEET